MREPVLERARRQRRRGQPKTCAEQESTAIQRRQRSSLLPCAPARRVRRQL